MKDLRYCPHCHAFTGDVVVDVNRSAKPAEICRKCGTEVFAFSEEKYNKIKLKPKKEKIEVSRVIF